MIAVAKYLRSVFELTYLYLFGGKSFLVRQQSQNEYWLERLEDDFNSNSQLEKTDPYYGLFFEEVVTLLGSEKDAVNFLDVGCHYGRRTNMLAWRFPDKTFTGTDLNRQNIDFGLRRLMLAPNIKLLDANAVDLPFPDNSFDVVYTIVSVSHMSHDIVRSVLQEMARVCRRAVILVEIDLFSWPIKKQIATVGMGYMYFHDYLAIAPPQLSIKKVLRMHCGEIVPRYCAFVFSKKI